MKKLIVIHIDADGKSDIDPTEMNFEKKDELIIECDKEFDIDFPESPFGVRRSIGVRHHFGLASRGGIFPYTVRVPGAEKGLDPTVIVHPP